ncbi:N-acetyl-D-Glu racemase DgcA [uncultured Psychromonas sp.]|uniref:N-acetyl-D-Glu racemase DgcA n=1 Tax=uncultured Psychromonas sp. TaxID=173974 RepID=UPI00262CDBBF|nr:N-acetyl-D-Glu racemase DgcA [uncultured Psychromonas sp.]
MQVNLVDESWLIEGSFTISRGSRTHANVVVVELQQGEHIGRGECVPYARYDESIESVIAELAALKEQIAAGLTRQEMQSLLPAGAARNALDCAYWDLACKKLGQRIWQQLEDPQPKPLMTAFTLSLDTPERMKEAAIKNAHRPLLKLKLAGEGDVERVAAVREGSPNARIIVDANEGWNEQQYLTMVPELVKLGVEMIEQPFPASDDAALAHLPRPITLCADESCHDSSSLKNIIGRYDMINIKLDKTGGLTEAIALKEEAEKAGLQIMVGCMVATSLAMAPAFIVAQNVQIVDLDGPLLLAEDRQSGIQFDESLMNVYQAELWG